MDPPQQIPKMDDNSLMIITPTGRILQLFTPIRAVSCSSLTGIAIGTTVFVEAIGFHTEYKICYKITGSWHAHSFFSIIK